MDNDKKAKIGLIAAIGTVIGLLAVIFHKFFPKDKKCCGDKKGKCCGD